MCLIALALDRHPDWPVVLASNRDEFHQRASAAFGPWPQPPGIHGGRDLVAGGGWLALRGDRLAAVTNVRRMHTTPAGAPSRGWLVRDALTAEPSIATWVDQLGDRADAYAGFNLLALDADSAWFASNRPAWSRQALRNGIHVVANASLNTPWPKSQRLNEAVEAWCRRGELDTAPLFAALADETPVRDAELPDTGLPIERERLLAPAFIRSPQYGTRASTIILGDRQGRWQIIERRFRPDGMIDAQTRHTLKLPGELA